jgi:hypothetical protein
VTLFSGDSLLVSLPGAEVGGMSLPGSLSEPDAVLANPMSLELRSALEILQQEAARRGLPITCVARPEMFTHGKSEAWFRSRTSPAAQHLCLSDGSTVKHLPYVPTHVFFYCLARNDSTAALQKLSRRAPELMLGLRSQVNTALLLGRKPGCVRPEPIYLTRTKPLRLPPSTFLPFFLNRDSAEDSANRIEHAGRIDPDSLGDYAAMTYLPLTHAALADRGFGRAMTDLILQRFFDPATLLLLRLPPDSTLSRSIEPLLAAVRTSGIVLPRTSPPNILFASHDLEEDHAILHRSPVHMIVHDSFDFWRHTADFYAQAQQVTVLADPELAARAGYSHFDISSIYGAKAVRQWGVDPADAE